MQGLLDIVNKWWNVLHVSTSGIVLRYSVADPTITSVTSDGYARIVSWKNGQQQVQSWNGGELTNLDVSADVASDIVIYGRITKLNTGDNSTFINVRGDKFLQELYASNSTMTALDLRSNTVLQVLKCRYCASLLYLDLSQNTDITSIDLDGCIALRTIKYNAVNSSVSGIIAMAVTHSNFTAGTFHLRYAAPYNAVIENACTSKGWSVLYDL